MPSQAVPWVIAIILYFGTFLVSLAGVVVWCALPRRGAARKARLRTSGQAQRI